MAAFVIIALPIVLLGGGERAAYPRTFTSFPGGQASFGEFGFNYILNDAPLMAENDLYVEQLLMFNGSAPAISMHFTAARPLYSFMASLLAPLAGVMPALLIVNVVAWALAVLLAWRFTRGLGGDQLAGAIAATFVCAGLGFAIHSHDFSPHLVSFTMYYLGLVVVYESRVWVEARPLKTHLLLAIFLALACLTYTIAIVFTFGYVLVALRRNKWWHIALATGIAFSSRYLHEIALNVSKMYAARGLLWTPIATIESNYLDRSLSMWLAQFADPVAGLRRLLDGILQFSLFEVPLLVLLGIASWVVVIRGAAQWRFVLAFYLLPLIAGLAYLNFSTTRGYMVYGASLLLYAPLAIVLARGYHIQRYRAPAIAVLLVLLAGQVFWTTSFLWGYLAPAKMFFGFGYTEWIPHYLTRFAPGPVLSLTGLEPTPLMFGGDSTLVAAGMYVPSTPHTAQQYSPMVALLCRGVIVTYALALVVMTARAERPRIVGIGCVLAGLVVFPVLLPLVFPPARPSVFSTFYANHLPPDSHVVYTVRLSDAFVGELRRLEPGAAKVQFATPGIHPPHDVSVASGDRVLAASSTGVMLLDAADPPATVVRQLADTHTLVLDMRTRDKDHGSPIGTSLFGWQRNGLPQRQLLNGATGKPWPTPTLPQLEVRLVDREGRALLVGF